MEDYSICPLCGGIMDKGSLTAGGYRIIWTEEARRFSAFPEGNDRLIERLRFSGKHSNTAWCCRKCHKIIISEYGK